MLIRVSLSYNIYNNFTYRAEDEKIILKTGQRVVVPVGTRFTSGWIVGIGSNYQGRVKKIIGIIKQDFLPDERMIATAKSLAKTYFSSIGMMLDYSLSPKRKTLKSLCFNKEGKTRYLKNYNLKDLYKESDKGLLYFFYKTGNEVAIEGQNITTEPLAKYKNIIIRGLDRIKLYQDYCNKTLSAGNSVLIIVPDNLTAGYIQSMVSGVDVYNSSLKVGQREELWQAYRNGKTGIITGGLLALMLPIANLGCIIIDRSESYLYNRKVYSGINLNLASRIKAEVFNIPLIEGAGSKTTGSIFRQTKVLNSDRSAKEKTDVDVRMLKSNDRGIPQILIEMIKHNFLQGKKVLLIVNRKQPVQFYFCSKCQKITRCPACSGVLKVTSASKVSCSKCIYSSSELGNCPVCKGELERISDISISSLSAVIMREISEDGISIVSAEEIKDLDPVISQVRSNLITISTPIIINPYFKNIFDTIIYIRPESILNMGEYNSAEMIFSMVSELRELLKVEGKITVFSLFHFHYCLKLINDEELFFDRELKYREWFQLPPFSNVYNVEVKAGTIRLLGQKMRECYFKFKHDMNIKKMYLLSRKKIKGSFMGILEIHNSPETVAVSEILAEKMVTVRSIAV